MPPRFHLAERGGEGRERIRRPRPHAINARDPGSMRSPRGSFVTAVCGRGHAARPRDMTSLPLPPIPLSQAGTRRPRPRPRRPARRQPLRPPRAAPLGHRDLRPVARGKVVNAAWKRARCAVAVARQRAEVGPAIPRTARADRQVGRAAHDLGLGGLLGGSVCGRRRHAPSVDEDLATTGGRGRHAVWPLRHGQLARRCSRSSAAGRAPAPPRRATTDLSPRSGRWRGPRTCSSASWP